MARLLEPTYDSAVNKLAFDRQLAAYIKTKRSDDLQNTAWRLERCSDDHNIWFINAPESGWLHGRFWKCRSKLCSYCLGVESYRRRRSLRELLAAYQPTTDATSWRFVTFTIENPETSIASTRSIVNQAWSKLRKRVCFAAVLAGCKSEEFTLTQSGYHYHLHTLLHFSNRPDYQQWRRHWTECVSSSGGFSTNLFGYNTADGMLIVDFRAVRDYRNITNELCKYITKPTDFNKLSKAALLEMAAVKRWHRMFEVFGDLRSKRQTSNRSGTERAFIVHTKRLSDGWQTDRKTFEERRTNQRYFAIDHLEATFGSKVWTLPELRNAVILREKQ